MDFSKDLEITLNANEAGDGVVCVLRNCTDEDLVLRELHEGTDVVIRSMSGEPAEYVIGTCMSVEVPVVCIPARSAVTKEVAVLKDFVFLQSGEHQVWVDYDTSNEKVDWEECEAAETGVRAVSNIVSIHVPSGSVHRPEAIGPHKARKSSRPKRWWHFW